MNNNVKRAYDLLEDARLRELSKTAKLTRHELTNVITCAAGTLVQEIGKKEEYND